MTWDGSKKKLVCKNESCGVPKDVRTYSNDDEDKYAKNRSIDVFGLPGGNFLETVLRNYQKNIVVKNRRFRVSKRPAFTLENVNFQNIDTGLYLLINRWNLPNEKYIDVPGDILTGLEKYHKKSLTFFLAETSHDMYNWDRFSRDG